MAKSLFIFLFFSFSFLFLFGLIIRKKYGKVSYDKCHISQSYIRILQGSYYMIISYNECGKVVHRPYSSCISSVQNLIETLLSFSC